MSTRTLIPTVLILFSFAPASFGQAIFSGSMTDVQYTITMRDTETGAVKIIQGQQGVQKSGNDVNAF